MLSLGVTSATDDDDDPLSAAVVDLACSSAAPCTDITFHDINIDVPSEQSATYACENVDGSGTGGAAGGARSHYI